MGIKSKSYKLGIKITAFMIIFILPLLIIRETNRISHELTAEKEVISHISDIFATDFADTQTFRNMRFQAMDAADTVIRYKSEQNILSGEFVDDRQIENYKEDLFYNAAADMYRQEINELFSAADESGETIGIGAVTEIYYSDSDLWETKYRERFEEEYAEDIKNYRQNIINEQLDSYNYYLNYLKSCEYLDYYIKSGESIISNVNFISEDYEYSYKRVYSNDGDENYIIAFKQEFIDLKTTRLMKVKAIADDFLVYFLICAGIWLFFLAYLIYAAGRKASEPQSIRLFKTDRWFNEINLALMLTAFGGAVFFAVILFTDFYHVNKTTIAYIKVTDIYTVMFAVCAMLFVWFFLTLVRHIKNRTFIKNFLVYKICRAFIRRLLHIAKSLGFMFSKGNPLSKIIIFITVFGLLTMIPFVGFLTIPIALAYAYKLAKNYLLLKDGAALIKGGVYDAKIEIAGNSEFARLAGDINEIAAGLGEEVERRTKSERLKTELIVNVSHDIKTPLTSLITYTDLLKKEETDNENIKKYAEILSQKSDRLKKLTDDLFESAKAASGNLSVNTECVDVNSLIIQGLAEMDDRIKDSGLEFKTNLPHDKVYAKADGKLLWRITENLLSNALKYSMPGTRVYIDVSQDEKYVAIAVKNISAIELNISEDEATERFKRGDPSRTGEGSGLGLDIAKSLALCQNGELNIKIDGDLFKAEVKIPKN